MEGFERRYTRMPSVRALLLNQFYPPDTAPTGLVLHDLARTLVKRGHEVDVFCSRRSYDGEQRFPTREFREGVRVRRLAGLGWNRRRSWMRVVGDASFLASLLAEMLRSGGQVDMVEQAVEHVPALVVRVMDVVRRDRKVAARRPALVRPLDGLNHCVVSP